MSKQLTLVRVPDFTRLTHGGKRTIREYQMYHGGDLIKVFTEDSHPEYHSGKRFDEWIERQVAFFKGLTGVPCVRMRLK